MPRLPRSIAFMPCLIAICILAAARASFVDQASTTQPQTPSKQGAVSVKVSGTGLTSIELGLDKLQSMPRATVKVKEKDGEEAAYEGVRVADILAAAGLKFGQSLRGERLSDYLLAEAGDGYRVVFALTELDPDFSDRVVLLADRRDGKAIEGRDGPLRIIVSDERKHARWVRNVAAMTIQSAAARPAETRPADATPLSLQDLHMRPIIGDLGVPLGTCADIEAVVVSGRDLSTKQDADSYLLRVTRVNGKALPEPALMRFDKSPFSDIKVAVDAFSLHEMKTGRKAARLTDQEIAELEKDYVGSTMHLIAYESGRFSGIPHNLPQDTPPWQDRIFGLSNKLDILEQLP